MCVFDADLIGDVGSACPLLSDLDKVMRESMSFDKRLILYSVTSEQRLGKDSHTLSSYFHSHYTFCVHGKLLARYSEKHLFGLCAKSHRLSKVICCSGYNPNSKICLLLLLEIVLLFIPFFLHRPASVSEITGSGQRSGLYSCFLVLMNE